MYKLSTGSYDYILQNSSQNKNSRIALKDGSASGVSMEMRPGTIRINMLVNTENLHTEFYAAFFQNYYY